METTFRDHSNTNNVSAYSVGIETDVHSQERWSGIMEYKKKFIQNQLDDLYSNPYMNPEVVDSWLRSRESGLDPFTETINDCISPDNLKDVLEENDLIIESTKILFAALKLKDLVIASRYALYLFDKNSILLLHEGDLLAPDNSMVGTVWSEESAGTCAHHLAVQLKRPYHLLGPEHYCVIMDNSNSSAAPVLDDEGEVIGVLVLSQHLPNNAGDNAYLSLSSHTMGLITAMAAAVENRMKLKKSYEEVRAAHLRQKATLAFIDEGIITLEKSGKIVHVNKEATRIFRRPAEELENSNIHQFLNKQSQLMLLVEQGENVDIDENFMVENEEQPYFVNIRSVLDPGFKHAGGAILRLNSAEKINALVASRSGAKATYNFDSIIGESDIFKKTILMGKRFAKSTENVLLIGESGTGKELFAQSMHNEYRPHGPFIAVNCAAMPRNLIESELFGYEPGSFTGAERSGRPGKIELAHGGTLFLDEIGDMPLELQAVLLRVLEDKQVMRIGGRRYKKVDFRLIAATNKELDFMIQEKLFREDLYFRLSVLSINLPPLRERGNDLELLSRYFIKNYCKKMEWKLPEISKLAKEKIREYKWPGNVRQLENAVIYAVNTAQNGIIEATDLPAIILGGSSPVRSAVTPVDSSPVQSIEAMERIVIENALYKTKNNITKAAEILGIGKSTLYRKLKDYDIVVEDK